MIGKIHNMIFEFVRDKGVCPSKIFMTYDEYGELKKEVETNGFLNIITQDESLKVCGLTINATYPQVGMHLTT